MDICIYIIFKYVEAIVIQIIQMIQKHYLIWSLCFLNLWPLKNVNTIMSVYEGRSLRYFYIKKEILKLKYEHYWSKAKGKEKKPEKV